MLPLYPAASQRSNFTSTILPKEGFKIKKAGRAIFKNHLPSLFDLRDPD
jgi:hypothetical protein